MTTVSDPLSRVDSTYEYLLNEITEFRLRTGAPLSENRLAEQLGVSRTPVREALQRLEKEGLVKRTESARFTVSQPTPQEADDACDLLEILDTYVCTRAAERLTAADESHLRATVEQMRVAAMSGQRDAWAEADASFHRLINELAGNELVAETVKETRRRIQRFWLRASTGQDRLLECSDEHLTLAVAMIEKDYAAIGPAVAEHIGHMRIRVLDLLETAALLLGE